HLTRHAGRAQGGQAPDGWNRRCLTILNIEEALSAPCSSWQSPYRERKFGWLLRACLAHGIVWKVVDVHCSSSTASPASALWTLAEVPQRPDGPLDPFPVRPVIMVPGSAERRGKHGASYE